MPIKVYIYIYNFIGKKIEVENFTPVSKNAPLSDAYHDFVLTSSDKLFCDKNSDVDFVNGSCAHFAQQRIVGDSRYDVMSGMPYLSIHFYNTLYFVNHKVK